MTREEAIRCLSVYSSTNGSGLCTDEQHYEAKQIAIKALEQEPKPMVEIDLYSVIKQKYIGREVLDKIRAEIWDLQYGPEEKSMTNEDKADAYNNAIRQTIEIVDKYKAESEDKE
jgi:acyl-CoA-binding protein